MVITPPRIALRKALAVSAVAIAATVIGASSPIASAAPVSSTAKLTSLDTAANWAIVKEAAASGYSVPAKLNVNCGITR